MGPAAFDSNLFWTIHVVYVENILALAAPQFHAETFLSLLSFSRPNGKKYNIESDQLRRRTFDECSNDLL
jgi:hypothetical protein